jgi:hypothetical protein
MQISRQKPATYTFQYGHLYQEITMINNPIPTQNQKYIILVGGGDVQICISFLIALKQIGYRVAAIGPDNHSIFEQNDIPFFKYTFNRWQDLFSGIKSYLQLLQPFKVHKPDTVTKPAIIAAIAALHASINL